jgi:sugar phosphate isomerase/epimerase
MDISRRNFISALSSGVAVSLAPRVALSAPPPQPAPSSKPIALGIDNFAVRAFGWKAPQLIDYAKELQLDTLFLSDIDCLPSLEDAALREIKAQADSAGLSLYVGSWSICPSSVRFKPNWGTAEEHLRTGIRVSKALGSPVFRVILGAMDDRKTPGGINARINDTVKVLKACKGAAMDAGIKIAVENHAGDMHSWELVRLIEEAGPDFVGVNIDSGNAAWTLEDPLDLLERLGPYTICSSLRDDMIWNTPDGVSIQWTAMGDGLVDWNRYMDRWRVLCPHVPVQIETISGFSKTFPYKTEAFWQHYDRRPEVLAKFEALAAKGHPLDSFKTPQGMDKKEAEKAFQKSELERSIQYCRKELGLGRRDPKPSA